MIHSSVIMRDVQAFPSEAAPQTGEI